MKAPEKIYLYPSDRAGEEYETEWGDKPWGEDYVEYIRTDAFIDGACEWMSTHLPMQYDGLSDYTKDFRKAMKKMKGE